jgi:hypothetical protein
MVNHKQRWHMDNCKVALRTANRRKPWELPNYGNSFSTIGNGGAPEFALEEITGASAITNMRANVHLQAPTLSSQTATQTWKHGQAVNFTLAANTFTDPQHQALTYAATLANGATLPTWLHFNSATETFTGAVPGNAAGLAIKVTATDTSGLSASETFSVLTPAAPPVVTAQTANQTWTKGQTLNFKLATNTFTDPQQQAMTYTATQANGAALPTWLHFNGSTDTFTGTVPTSASPLSVKVTATDVGGLSASETFAVSIANAVIHLAHAISTFAPHSAIGGANPAPSETAENSYLAPPHH